jgi:hypothetical protein
MLDPSHDTYLDRFQVLQQVLLLEVSTPKKHVQVAGLVQAVLNLATLEILDSLRNGKDQLLLLLL